MHKREGAQEPRCARSEGRRGAVGFYLVVAARPLCLRSTSLFHQRVSSLCEGTEVDHIKPQKIVVVSHVGHGVICCITPLALQMLRFKGFFALFPRFQKSAEMTRQVEISTLSAHQMAHGGVVPHLSSWTPAACELEESSPRVVFPPIFRRCGVQPADCCGSSKKTSTRRRLLVHFFW